MRSQGPYVVDEITVSGPPDTISIKGKASDMRGSGKTIRSGSWEDVPLSKIVSDIAARNGWEPGCPVATKVARADQLSESDFNFITCLAKQYDCTAKVADGKLLVMPRQGGQSASGKEFGAITITRKDVSRWQFRLGDRNTHGKVATKHQDKKGGNLAMKLGNTSEADGDGQRYRGRGLIQITGRNNYQRCSLALFGDERLLRTPELLELPQWAAESAAWFWWIRELNALADRDEFEAITRKINGGLNGLVDRLQLWERARAVLCVSST
ncbi:chitinase class I [Pseudomonas sp. SJZ080]|uniref:contractile injection system protein, VgrG/Pvc8 family n=1 Tax=Pseudomonas sp. SJZ080 TaxID=2572888 RepID=UPI001199984D|nr:contractile injection system protein, VgrG/Pvc8 family [Pseudomonas sp. SJZ080]TWC57213.1 chitinase class I [Pseudomonas sp. SJZ080]